MFLTVITLAAALKAPLDSSLGSKDAVEVGMRDDDKHLLEKATVDATDPWNASVIEEYEDEEDEDDSEDDEDGDMEDDAEDSDDGDVEDSDSGEDAETDGDAFVEGAEDTTGYMEWRGGRGRRRGRDSGPRRRRKTGGEPCAKRKRAKCARLREKFFSMPEKSKKQKQKMLKARLAANRRCTFTSGADCEGYPLAFNYRLYATGYRPQLQSKGGYYFMSKDCWGGRGGSACVCIPSDVITDEEECYDALGPDQLNVDLTRGGYAGSYGGPPGCGVSQGGNAHFNTDTARTSSERPEIQPVCKRATTR